MKAEKQSVKTHGKETDLTVNFNTPSHFVPKIKVHKCSKIGRGKDFVQMSARFCLEGTCRRTIVPSSIYCLIKW